MAERRMFTKKITDSDAFTELPSSAQALYFHLNQGADDDGFNNQIQIAMFRSHATLDDLKLLMCKNFIIRFESGVIVIKHWRMHNTLRKDRYTPTNFQEEFKLLGIKSNGSYTFSDDIKGIKEDGCHLVAERLPQDSIGKVSIDKSSIGKDSINNEHSDESENLPIPSEPTKAEITKSLETEFETIWEHYPNKKGKDNAKTKYIRARKNGTTYEEVVQGLKNYLNYIKHNNIDIQYVKHGSTWFNQKCWKDEYPIIEKNGKRPTLKDINMSDIDRAIAMEQEGVNY